MLTKYLSNQPIWLTVFLFFSFSIVKAQDPVPPDSSFTEITEDIIRNPLKVRSLTLQGSGHASVSEHFHKFKNLKQVSFIETDLKKIPDGIDSLSKIESFEISKCPDFEFNDALSKLSRQDQLTSLKLSGNNLFLLPYSIGKLSSLKTLDLSNNKLIELPQNINDIQSLEKLNLSQNQLENVFEAIGDLSLNKLNLSYQRPLNPTLIKDLQNVRASNLVLRGFDTLPAELNSELVLQSLDLSNGKFKQIPEAYENLQIQNLVMKDCRFISGEDLFKVFKVDTLSSLTVKGYQIRSLPKELEDAKYLKSIKVEDAWLSKFDLNLENATNFEGLEIANSRINDMSSIEKMVNSAPSINKLSISNSGLTALPNIFSIGAIPKVLDFKYNKIEDIPYEMLATKGILELNLERNPLNYSSIDALKLLDTNLSVFVSTRTFDELEKEVEDYIPTQYGDDCVEDKDVDEFIVSGIEPTMLTSSSSKVIFCIPEHAFLDHKDSIYRGEVRIEYKEYESSVEILADGVDMTIGNNGITENFLSDGMFSFRAFDSTGAELFTNPKKLIDVSMEVSSASKDYDMYIYEDSVGWVKVDNVIEEKDKIIDTLRDKEVWVQDKLFFIDQNGIYSDSKPQRPSFYSDKYGLEFDQPDGRRGKKTVQIHSYISFENNRKAERQHSWYTHKNGESMAFAYHHPDEREALKEYVFDIESSASDARRFENVYRSWNKRTKWWQRSRTNLVKIRVSPNEEKDNFLLTMKLGKEEYTLEVFPRMKSNKPKYLQKKTRDWYELYENGVALTDSARKTADEYYEQEYEKYREEMNEYRKIVDSLRSLNLLLITDGKTFTRSFSLLGFGLVNCDKFLRIPPSQILCIQPEFVLDTNSEESLKVREMTVLDEGDLTTITYPGKTKKINLDKESGSAIVLSLAGGGLAIVSKKAIETLKKDSPDGKKPIKIPAKIIKDPKISIPSLTKLLFGNPQN